MSEQSSPLSDPAPAGRAAAGRRVLALPRPLTADWARVAFAVALVGVVIFGGYLRFTHVNWDSNGNDISGHLHPDERFLTQISTDTHAPSSVFNYFDTKTSGLNPYNITHPDGSKQTTFVYGTLPLFMNKFVASNLHTLTLGAVSNYDDYDGYNISGRFLSAVFDMGTLLLVFLLAKELMNRYAALLAALLYASTAFAIQNAHFFVVDPFVAFFATATIFFAVRSARYGHKRDFALAGVSAGLAAACKITAVSLLPVIVLAIGVYNWPAVKPYVAPWWYGPSRRYGAQQDGRRLDRAVLHFIVGSLIALVAAFIAFRIAMPYAFATPGIGQWFTWHLGKMGPLPVPYPDIMNHHWLADEVDQQNLLSGNGAFPPNIQWIGRSKWAWPLQQMVAWGMGPALGITAWLGVLFAAVLAFTKRQGVWLVPLAWVLGYFGFMGAQFSLYMRYFLPLYPTLTVLAAVLLWSTWRWAWSRDPFARTGRIRARLSPMRPALPWLAGAGVGAVTLMTVFMGIAFYHIYTSPVTRAEASRWIYQNVPEGSVIGHESWDDAVPYGVSGVQPRNYGSVTFNNFNVDDQQHVDELLSDLDQVDYIALASGRVSLTVTRVPAAWPVTSRYYELLANDPGALGFEKVAEFTSYPSIFGLTLNDTGAEESYSVYDHPTVIIYKKTSAYTPEKAREALHADAFEPGVSALPGDLAQNAVRFTPAVLAKQEAGGTWSSIFHPGNVINEHPLIFWLLTIEIAAMTLVPVSIVVLRGLPDRGYLLTKPLGVLGLAYLSYAAASRGLVDYTRTEIAGVLGMMALFGVVTGLFWRREVVAWVRERWRFVVFCEALFLLLFVGAYWIRLQNPDLWHPARGGEKPMDLAYLIGVVRTTDLTQGPIDPWNAGGYLNYYYFGQFIAATVTKLTDIVPEVAYNLIVPMFFALAGAATFSLAYNLCESTRRLMRRRPGGFSISARGPIIAGLLAIFLVLVAGNLRAVGILEQDFSRVSPWHTDVPLLGGIVAFIGGTKAVLFGDASFRQLVYGYDWWGPSRALTVANPNEVTPITEFPFWTFLFADLHAHLMAIPFSLTAAAVALGAVLNFTRTNTDTPRTREVQSWVLVAVLGLIVGALRWINSWDYPPFMLLAAAGLIIGERAKEGRLNLRVLVIGGLKSIVMAALSFVFFSTFAKNYNMAYSGFSQSEQTTALSDYLSHFGILLFLVAALVIFGLNRSVTRNRTIRTLLFGRGRRRPVDAIPVTLGLIAAGAIIIWAGTFERWGVTMLAFVGLVAVVLCAWREMRSPSPTAPAMLFVYGMVALGLGLSGGVELFTLDGDIGRMNTVFKFYEHVWLMWGVVGAFALWYLLAVVRPQEAFLRRMSIVQATFVRAPRYAFGAFAAIFLVLALAYPYFGTRARIHDRFDPAQGTGNNGMAYMNTAVYTDNDPTTGLGGEHVLKYDRDGIDWMRAHVQGTPTILEGITPIYHYGSRVSIYTGLPDVLGWDWHQSQQRATFASQVAQRKTDVDLFYSTTDIGQARQILRKYDVQYVIVGDVERNYYGGGIAKFNDGLGGVLELAYQNPGMQIWHVIPGAQTQLALAGG